MAKTLPIKAPQDFSFIHTTRSHGWYDLEPFSVSGDKLRYVFSRGPASSPVAATLSSSGDKIRVRVDADDFDRDGVLKDVIKMLRLDEQFEHFYAAIEKTKQVEWAREVRAGRLLRSATVWEDLVKTMCTTNCSWSLTKVMVRNLVDSLGVPTATGEKAFPTAEAMAAENEDFYRTTIRAGYRAPYMAELAEAVASLQLDPESWLTDERPTAELKRSIKAVKGIGDYAAENLLKLIGRYDGLALDSWLRGGFYAKHNKGRKCKDAKIEKHYARFGDWRGLAIWCDMTEDWFTGPNARI